MRLSEIIRALRPASFAEKGGVSLCGVTSDGADVTVPYQQSGWVNIADGQYTSGSPLAVTGGVRTQITINGAGATTNTTYANGMNAAIWTGNKFRPSALGEVYNLRLTMTVAVQDSGSGHYLTFDADIGGGGPSFIAASQYVPLIKGQGVASQVTIAAPFFCLDTFGLNGAQLFITPSVDVTVWGAAIFIQRTFKP